MNTDGGMIQKVKSHILDQIQKGIEAKLPTEVKDDYLRILVSGMKIIFSDETHQMSVKAFRDGLKTIGDPNATVVNSTLSLLAIIYRESGGKMSFVASFPAGIVLLGYVFELAEQMGVAQITNETVAAAIKDLTVGILKLFGVTREQFSQAVQMNKKSGAAPAPIAGAQPAAKGVTP